MKHKILKNKFKNFLLSNLGYTKLPLIDSNILLEIEEYYKSNIQYISNTYVNTILLNDCYERMKHHSYLKMILKDYLEKTIVPHKIIIGTFFMKYNNREQSVGPHIDPTVINILEYDDFIIWIPLVDTIYKSSGRIGIQPFSHLLNRRLNLESKVAIHFSQYKLNHVKLINIKRGEPILFFNNLLHGSEINTYYDVRPAISLKIAIKQAKVATYHIRDINKGIIDLYEQEDNDYYVKNGWNELEKPKSGNYFSTIYNYK